MNTVNEQNFKYAIVKSLRAGKTAFVNMADSTTIEEFRNQNKNQHLLISTWYSEVPDILELRNYPLFFCIVASDLEKARVSALETSYYIEENFNIPAEYMEIIYSGGGEIGNNISSKNSGSGSNNANEYNTAAEIIISIPPVVYDGPPTPLMPALNYYLARQMANDGIENINIDVYQRNHFIRLPNSINTTGKFAIQLSKKELLYLDANGFIELSKQPRPEDSMILPHQVPETTEWFNDIHAEYEKILLRQDDLQKLMLEKGWEVPPCIRRLQGLCLYDNIRLEAYRVISQFYSWIVAAPDQIRHLINFVDRRNPIKNYQKLNEIITFAIENPWFVGCQHYLLEHLCPAGKCFMAELIEEYEKPSLFEQV